MKELYKKIAGICIICLGIVELIIGIHEGTTSTILMGIGFVIIGTLYFMEKNNDIKE